MHQVTKKAGFTLIELMLAMSFVAVLLIAIAMLTIQISSIYTKGITIKQVNEAGLELSSDLQRSIQSSAKFDASGDGDAKSFVRLQGTNSGRLCLGSYSYAWNYGEDIAKIAENQTLPNHYEIGASNKVPIRFVKVADANKQMCKTDADGAYPDIPSTDQSTELLATGDRDLAIHEFTITGSEDKGLYAITLVLGTNDRGLLQDNECKVPSDSQGGEDYCAVNKFDIVARAGSKEGVRN